MSIWIVLAIVVTLYIYRHAIYSSLHRLWQACRWGMGYIDPPLDAIRYDKKQLSREASRLGIVMPEKAFIRRCGYWQSFLPPLHEPE